ncbi:MAG: YybH family protein [Gemmatimonadales bacterium]
MLVSAPAVAQVEEVRADEMRSLAAWKAGNLKEFAKYFSEDTRGFNLDGGTVFNGFSATALRVLLAAGFRFDVEPRDIDIEVYGNTAVSIAYLVGSVTFPGGTTRKGTWRYSDTRIKQQGKWRVVQYHISRLATPQRRGDR